MEVWLSIVLVVHVVRPWRVTQVCWLTPSNGLIGFAVVPVPPWSTKTTPFWGREAVPFVGQVLLSLAKSGLGEVGVPGLLTVIWLPLRVMVVGPS